MLELVIANDKIPPTHHDCKRDVWLALLNKRERIVAGVFPAPGYSSGKVPGKTNVCTLPCVTGDKCHRCGKTRDPDGVVSRESRRSRGIAPPEDY